MALEAAAIFWGAVVPALLLFPGCLVSREEAHWVLASTPTSAVFLQRLDFCLVSKMLSGFEVL